MRKPLVLSVSNQMVKYIDSEKPTKEMLYQWFQKTSDIEELSNREQFMVLIATKIELPRAIRKPTHDPSHNVVTGGNVKLPPKDAVTVSSECMRNARKALGAKPYEPDNPFAYDKLFIESCIVKYGIEQWQTACAVIRSEKERWGI